MRRVLKQWVLIAALMFIYVCAQAQTNVTGTVTDQSGETIPGVNIMVKGTSTGIITDIDGKYSLSVPKADDVLVFSFIGYKSQEVAVGNRTVINVSMSEDTQLIDEIVVIGYGVAKKSDLTGAVARADLSAVQNTTTVNIAQGIKGAVPGLNIGFGEDNRAGNSDDIAISIRGRNSLSGTTSPLIVVDGLIFRGGINDINPNDIESIDVLKDASSAAIYGSQAANGVLMITTKSVKSDQKPVIAYNGSFALQKLTNEKMKGVDRADYIWQIESHALEESRLGPDFLLPNPDWDITSRFRLASQHKGWAEGTDTDWYGMGSIDMPYIQDHTISIGGRSNAVNYYMSYGFMDQKNLIINDTYKRNSFRVNLDTRITNWLSVGTQSFFTIHDMSGQTPSMDSITSEIPIMAAYDDDGNIIRRLDRGSINILVIPENKDLDMRYSLSGNFYGDVKIPFVEGLSYRIQYNNTLTFTRQYRFDYTGNTDQGSAYKNYSNRNEWVLDHIVKYIRKFGEHSVDATFVYNLEKRTFDSTNSASNFFSDMSLNYNKLSAGRSDQNVLSSAAWKETSLGIMGRIVYGFKDRYIMTATLRHDGFSGFGENYKTGNFPSLAFAWRLSEEEFFKSRFSSVIQNLKLRASYGV
ncbi:MAG: SusC/RagA family TonB-linked outer membrane protein, partial [Tannerella sp.]|nr:SusC/RagA family TonB-linked outer membrane protein [Tannerella sp.]